MAENFTWYKVYDFETHGAEPQELFTLRAIDLEGRRVVLVRNDKGYYAVDEKCVFIGLKKKNWWRLW